jgi:hypothetical protein
MEIGKELVSEARDVIVTIENFVVVPWWSAFFWGEKAQIDPGTALQGPLALLPLEDWVLGWLHRSSIFSPCASPFGR